MEEHWSQGMAGSIRPSAESRPELANSFFWIVGSSPGRFRYLVKCVHGGLNQILIM